MQPQGKCDLDCNLTTLFYSLEDLKNIIIYLGYIWKHGEQQNLINLISENEDIITLTYVTFGL